LHLAEKLGEAFHDCASMHPDYLCCNVKVLAAVSNCPYECSYCFLQNYLTDTTLSVVADTDALLREVDEKTSKQPGRLFRVGTWELGDSLALEALTGTAAELVCAFAKRPNLLLELKTKSAQVSGLLDLPHNGRTVVSWTVNPEAVIRREEYRTAGITERIEAMRQVVAAGYPVAVHFDPMICYPQWREGYTSLIRRIFTAVPAERIAWISIGSLRFNPEMKKVMENNYPGSRATCAEMVLGDDGKVRYLKPLRVEMYRHTAETIRECAGSGPFIYLCMERWDVWKRVFGWHPHSTAHHDFLLT
ncbi:MAG: DNA photolyase, partial [Gammaproteobacteria bacterium]|nr:DNA photolyase [Gammaproteobacteria bacterium]